MPHYSRSYLVAALLFAASTTTVGLGRGQGITWAKQKNLSVTG
jgi:hypothetical protein